MNKPKVNVNQKNEKLDKGKILISDFTKLVVYDEVNKKELVIIDNSDEPIKILNSNLVVKLTPKYD